MFLPHHHIYFDYATVLCAREYVALQQIILNEATVLSTFFFFLLSYDF